MDAGGRGAQRLGPSRMFGRSMTRSWGESVKELRPFCVVRRGNQEHGRFPEDTEVPDPAETPCR
jgi:hypothetical protein